MKTKSPYLVMTWRLLILDVVTLPFLISWIIAMMVGFTFTGFHRKTLRAFLWRYAKIVTETLAFNHERDDQS